MVGRSNIQHSFSSCISSCLVMATMASEDELQRLREFVRSEYDHACLRSCRSRALYEGIKVAATSDLMLAYVDFFLGGDEKRPDLPPRLHQRLPMSLIFGGDGSYMAPFSLSNDNILNNLMSQSVPPTKWFRLVSGLNAQLRLVCRGRLRMSFRFLLKWIEVFANPALKSHGIHVDLACFQDTASGYYKYGLLVYAVDDENSHTSPRIKDETVRTWKPSWEDNVTREYPSDPYRDGAHLTLSERIGDNYMNRRAYGAIIDVNSLQTLEERRDIFYFLSFVLHNTKPRGHQDLVGLVISVLLLGDFSLVLLALLQFHGPRRSAGLARVYALWNLTSLFNVVVALLCGYVHYCTQSSGKRHPSSSQPWTISMDESEWWIFPAGLILCKLFQSQLINWHITNLEIQDRSVYGCDFELFWQS